MVQVFHCPWTFYNDHKCSVVRNEIYTFVSQLIWYFQHQFPFATTRPTVQNSEDWKHCAQENHAIIVMYSLLKSIRSKICLSLFKLDLRNYLTILKYLMISRWITYCSYRMVFLRLQLCTALSQYMSFYFWHLCSDNSFLCTLQED